MSEQEMAQRITAEVTRMSEECERGIIAVAVNAMDEPVAGLAICGPNCILFTHMIAPAIFLDLYLN